MSYYAVRIGRQKGVFNSYDEILPLVDKYSGASFRKFSTYDEALKFVNNQTDPPRRNEISRYMVKGTDNSIRDQPKIESKPLITLKTLVKKIGETPIISMDNNDNKCGINVIRKISTPAADIKMEYLKELSNNRPEAICSVVPSSPILNVYCDGSTKGNGKKNAAGGIGIWFGHNDINNVSEAYTLSVPTNQKAELYALLRTLKILEKLIENGDNHSFHIYTDSEYTINCVTKWLPGWIKKNWIKADGKAVKNVSLLKELSAVYNRNRRRYVIKHIKAHTGYQDIHSIGNSMADELANEGAMKHANYHSHK